MCFSFTLSLTKSRMFECSLHIFRVGFRAHPVNVASPKTRFTPSSVHFTAALSLDTHQKPKTALSSDSEEGNEADTMLNTLDPSIQPLHHLLSMPSSGLVEAIGISPHYGGAVLCAVSSKKYNTKSTLDIYELPHWTWNYTSQGRTRHRLQAKYKALARVGALRDISKPCCDHGDSDCEENGDGGDEQKEEGDGDEEEEEEEEKVPKFDWGAKVRSMKVINDRIGTERTFDDFVEVPHRF